MLGIRELRRWHRDAVTAASVVMVTSRLANNQLSKALADDAIDLNAAGISSVKSIGDCFNPSTIALAVYAGHRAAREMDAPPSNPDMLFRREKILIEK